jgi:hypothetical protein
MTSFGIFYPSWSLALTPLFRSSSQLGLTGMFSNPALLSTIYRLQAKKGVLSDDRTQSAKFLNSIQEPLYADVVMTLTTCIKNYSVGNKDGYLLPHLCVMGLVLQIYKHAQSHA